MLSPRLKVIFKMKIKKMKKKMKVMNWNHQPLRLKEKEELLTNNRESSMHLLVILELWTLTIPQDILQFLRSMLSLPKCKMRKKVNFKKVLKLWEACNLLRNQSMISLDKEKTTFNFLKESKFKVNNNKMKMTNNKQLETKNSKRRKRKSNNLKRRPKILNWSIHMLKMERMFIEKMILKV